MSSIQNLVIDGRRCAYRVDGDPALPWIVLSHSLAASHRMWDLQSSALERRRCVLRYDQRGHGASDPPRDEPATVQSLAADLLILMDALDVGRADLLGLSLGGTVSLAAALADSARVRSVICASARASATAGYAAVLGERKALALNEGMAAVVAPTLERWFTPAFRDGATSTPVLQSAREQILDTRVEGFCHCVEALQVADLQGRLSELRLPVLYVAGAYDMAVPPAAVRELHMSTPGSELVIIDDAAHLLNLEQPRAFGAAVCNWLDRQPTRHE